MPDKEKIYHDLWAWCREVSQKAKVFSEDAKDHALIKMILEKIDMLASAVAQTSEHMIAAIQEAKQTTKQDTLYHSVKEPPRRCLDCLHFLMYGGLCDHQSPAVKIENPYHDTTCPYFRESFRWKRSDT